MQVPIVVIIMVAAEDDAHIRGYYCIHLSNLSFGLMLFALTSSSSYDNSNVSKVFVTSAYWYIISNVLIVITAGLTAACNPFIKSSMHPCSTFHSLACKYNSCPKCPSQFLRLV